MPEHGAWKASVNFFLCESNLCSQKGIHCRKRQPPKQATMLGQFEHEKGPEQSRLMQILLDEAQRQQGLSKAELEQINNNLLKCPIDVD